MIFIYLQKNLYVSKRTNNNINYTFIERKVIVIDAFVQILKKEYSLNVDDFNETESSTDLIAFARLIQTLIILEPYTYPNMPDMGVGIADYQFEFLDEVTLNRLKVSINQQIEEYLPNNIIKDTVIEKLQSKDNKTNTIGIMFTLTKSIKGKDEIILLMNKKIESSKVISEIIF